MIYLVRRCFCLWSWCQGRQLWKTEENWCAPLDGRGMGSSHDVLWSSWSPLVCFYSCKDPSNRNTSMQIRHSSHSLLRKHPRYIMHCLLLRHSMPLGQHVLIRQSMLPLKMLWMLRLQNSRSTIRRRPNLMPTYLLWVYLQHFLVIWLSDVLFSSSPWEKDVPLQEILEGWCSKGSGHLAKDEGMPQIFWLSG